MSSTWSPTSITRLTLDLYDWVEENAKWLRDGKDNKRNKVECVNIADLISFLRGERVAEYPNMRGFLKRSTAAQSFIGWLDSDGARSKSLARRIVQRDGERTRPQHPLHRQR